MHQLHHHLLKIEQLATDLMTYLRHDSEYREWRQGQPIEPTLRLSACITDALGHVMEIGSRDEDTVPTPRPPHLNEFCTSAPHGLRSLAARIHETISELTGFRQTAEMPARSD